MLVRTSILSVLLVNAMLLCFASDEAADKLNASAAGRIAEGDCKAAMKDAEQAVRIYGPTARTSKRASALNNLGVAATYCADYVRAAAALEEAASLPHGETEREALANQNTNLANVYFYTGNYQGALQRYEKARQTIEAAGAAEWVPRRRALLAVNIAALRQKLGQDEQALDLYRQALADAAALRTNEYAQLHVNLGVLYRRLGDPHKALREYDIAADLFRKSRHKDGELGALKNRGIVYALDIGELKLAAGTFLRAHAVAEQAGIRREAMQARLYRGEALYRSGDYASARVDFREALEDARALNTSEELWKALFGLARVSIRLGNSQAAAPMLEEAIRTIEGLREKIQVAAVRRDFFAEKREVYDALIAITVSRGSPERVFELIERSKARTVQDRLRSNGTTASLEGVRQRLEPGAVLLQYWQSRRGNAVVWVSRDGAGVQEISVRDGDPGVGVIPRPAIGAAHLIIIPDGSLNRVPFEAIKVGEQFLIEKTAVTYLPSAALLFRPAPRRPWLPRPPWTLALAAFGDADAVSGDLDREISRLPKSRVEVDAIAAELGGRTDLHVGRGNTRQEFLAARAPIVHVATHGFADPDRPERSRLVFSSARTAGNADYVFLGELALMDLSGSQLITLSACNTEQGKTVRGEGIESFSRILLGAGAGATVTTLWRIDDAATARFMREFYAHLARGESKAAALQAAKVSFIRAGSPLADPSYWAAFVLSGDGTAPVGRSLSWTATCLLLTGLTAIAIAGLMIFRQGRRNKPAAGPGVNPPMPLHKTRNPLFQRRSR